MMLSASTWVPVTRMKTDMWTTVIPRAVTSCVAICNGCHGEDRRQLFYPPLRCKNGCELIDQTIYQNLEYNKTHFKKWEDDIKTSM